MVTSDTIQKRGHPQFQWELFGMIIVIIPNPHQNCHLMDIKHILNPS